MQKRPDIKTRKKLRIAMCFFFLLEIVICTMPFIHSFSPDGTITSASPFFMIMMLFGLASGVTTDVVKMGVLSLFIVLIPIIGFFFCALDKERNLKNIVSVLCCFAAVFLILSIPREYISIGGVFAIILYLLIMVLTSIAMVMRLSKDDTE